MKFNSSKENAVLLSGILATLLLVGMAIGQSDTATVDLSITGATILDVNPNQTSWSGLSIGGTSTYTTFYVENVGSNTITTVDVNVTGNDTNPYGGSDANEFDAGNFLMLNSSETGTGDMFYISKREWNESKPAFVTAPTGWTSSGQDENVGTFLRFKTAIDGATGGSEFFIFANRTGGGDCTDGTLYIGLINHTKEWTGSIDFTDANQYDATTTLAADSGWGFGDVSIVGHPLDGYCVRVSADCETVDFFHWDGDLDTGTICSNDELVYPTSSLTPGSNFEVYLQARIPLGVAAGSASTATLTFTAA